jgi:signal transduction histidine kinase
MVVSVVAWSSLHRSVVDQDRDLLKKDLSQATLIMQTNLEQTSLGLGSVGVGATLFDKQARALVSGSNSTVALVAKGAVVDAHGNVAPGQPQVRFAVGPDLYQGELLTGDLAKFALAARSAISGSPVIHVAGHLAEVYSIVPPSIGLAGYVAMEVSDIAPSRSLPQSRQFPNLDFALYATPTPRAAELLASTTSLRPLPQPTASTKLRVGALTWDVVGGASAPLLDSPAQAAPWIVLGVGLLLAVSLAFTVEALIRRQRYTASVVAQREAELRVTHDALLRQERLSAVGEMAAMMSHELRNAMGAMANWLFMTRLTLGSDIDPDVDSYLAHTEETAQRAAQFSNDILVFAREYEPSVETLDLADLVDEALRSAPPPDGIMVSKPEPGVTLDGDRELIVHLLENLVTNAYQAMSDDGSLSIEGSTTDGCSEVVVRDNGPGIDPVVAEHIFDPFITTKPTGSGLGLAIVKRIMDAHGGTVIALPGTNGGTTITLRLPRIASQDGRTPDPGASVRASGGS